MSLGDGRELDRLRVYAHPLRLRILSLLTGAELSATEVAKELDITQANASYHLRRLVAAGELVEAGTEKVRGGVAKRYAYRHREARAATGRAQKVGGHGQSDAERAAMITAISAELRRRSAERATGPTLFVDAEVWVEPQVWERARELVREASDLIHDSARPPRTTGTRQVSFVADLMPMKGGADGHA